jgi:transcriptional regulator with XRE-family HTH domain
MVAPATLDLQSRLVEHVVLRYKLPWIELGERGSCSKLALSISVSAPNPLNPIALNLRELIAERRMEHQELAALVGVSPNSVSNWVSGRFQPGRKRLLQLADVFELTVDELCGGPPGRTRKPSAGHRGGGETAELSDAIVRRLADLNPEPVATAASVFGADLMAVLREAQEYCGRYRGLPGPE